MESILLVLTNGVLGLFLGTQLTEAFLFVPYWKSLRPDDFFTLHRKYGKTIYLFFAPITIAATLLPLFTVAFALINHRYDTVLLVIMAAATLAFFMSYFLYFKKANRGFAERSFSDADLPQALKQWGNWHWVRIGFEAIAFGISLWLLIHA